MDDWKCPLCGNTYGIDDWAQIVCKKCATKNPEKLEELAKEARKRVEELRSFLNDKKAKEKSKFSDEYIEWINTYEFEQLANKVKSNAKWRCQICNARPERGNPLHAHHRSYQNMKTQFEIYDLVCLCKRCHELFHKHSKGRKK